MHNSFTGSGTGGQRERSPEASSRGTGGGARGESAARRPASEIAVGLLVPELRQHVRRWPGPGDGRRPSPGEDELAVGVHHEPGQAIGHGEHGQAEWQNEKSKGAM